MYACENRGLYQQSRDINSRLTEESAVEQLTRYPVYGLTDCDLAESMLVATRQELGSQDTRGTATNPRPRPIFTHSRQFMCKLLPVDLPVYISAYLHAPPIDDAVSVLHGSDEHASHRRERCTNCDARRDAESARSLARSRLQLVIEIHLKEHLARRDSWNAA